MQDRDGRVLFYSVITGIMWLVFTFADIEFGKQMLTFANSFAQRVKNYDYMINTGFTADELWIISFDQSPNSGTWTEILLFT